MQERIRKFVIYREHTENRQTDREQRKRTEKPITEATLIPSGSLG